MKKNIIFLLPILIFFMSLIPQNHLFAITYNDSINKVNIVDTKKDLTPISLYNEPEVTTATISTTQTTTTSTIVSTNVTTPKYSVVTSVVVVPKPYIYEIINDEVIITHITHIKDEIVTIPDTIEGYPVTKIKEKAGLSGVNNGCRDITIPKSIREIGWWAIGYVVGLRPPEHYERIDDMVIRGYKGTAAEIYANENGFTFVALDDNPEVTTATTMTTQTTTTSTTVSTTTTSRATTEATKATTSTTITTTTSATTVTTNSTTTISTSASTSASSTSGSTATTSQTTAATTTITTTINVKGDANGDNKLDARDAAFIAQKIALDKASELPKYADFNDDGTVNVRDAAAIARFLSSRKS